MNDAPLKFDLIKQDATTRARRGRVTTRHGSFDTPAFMPVGTQGTIKGILPDQVAATGSQIILANTYHPTPPPRPSPRHRLADHPRQHLPPHAPPRRGRSSRPRRPPHLHVMERPHPHRF